MPANGGSPTRLRSSNSVSHFANLTPKKEGGRFGWLGFIRIIAAVLALGVALFQPELAPAATIAEGLFQEGIDIYQFSRERVNRRRIISFGLSSLVNIVPVALAVRGATQASKSVYRIADNQAQRGFRYVVKGVDPEFKAIGEALEGGRNLYRGKTISRININKQKSLLQRGLIPPVTLQEKDLAFEQALQSTFSKSQDIEKAISGYRGTNYYVRHGEEVFSNRDLAILRKEIRLYATGKRSQEQILRKFNSSLSYEAKYELGFFYKTRRGGEVAIDAPYRSKLFKKIDSVANVYTAKAAHTITKERGIFSSILHWFGTNASAERQFYKSGRFWTQAAQLANPNDMAREILNKPTSFLLNGFKRTSKSTGEVFEWKGLKRWARGIRKSIDEKMPKVSKILKFPLGKKLFAKFKHISDELKKNGTVTQDQEFLMGWRTIKSNSSYSEVIFYFNPLNTNAKTPGSLNFGGKKPIHRTIRTSHLKYLAKTATPGHAYLKGEGGFPPIALSPGGKRPVSQVLQSEALALLSLTMPIGGLRNILSVISNFKNVITDVAHGVYKAKWKSVFTGTFKRLWVNKVTRILGQTVGNIVSKEAAGHLGRIFRTVGQGFQKTTTSTRYVNGRKIVDRSTSFSFKNDFNWRPLVKQALPLSVRSATIRKVPRTNTVRQGIKYKTYGTNLRRIPGLIK